MQYQLLVIPIISAFIGYLTNVVAIKLLFWPQKPFNFLFFEIQGLLPKRRADIATNIGELVENELLSLNDLIDRINTPEIQEKLIEKVINLLKIRIMTVIPNIIPSRLINIVIDSLEKVIKQEASNIVGEIFKYGADFLTTEIQVKQIVEDRINALDLDELEAIATGVASKELRFIELLGGLLGFIIGIVQVVILLVFPLV